MNFFCLFFIYFTITITPNPCSRFISGSQIWLGGFWTRVGFQTCPEKEWTSSFWMFSSKSDCLQTFTSQVFWSGSSEWRSVFHQINQLLSWQINSFIRKRAALFCKMLTSCATWLPSEFMKTRILINLKTYKVFVYANVNLWKRF